MNDKNQEQVTIGRHELLEIRSLAHNKIVKDAIPNLAKEDVGLYFMLNGLADFLQKRGITAPFKLDR